MINAPTITVALFCSLIVIAPANAASNEQRSQKVLSENLAVAMTTHNHKEIDRIKGAIVSRLDASPTTESPEHYEAFQNDQEFLQQFYSQTRQKQKETLEQLSRRFIQFCRERSWWITERKLAAKDIPQPLRAVASMIRGMLAIARTYPDCRNEAAMIARSGGDYLLSCSSEAGFAGAPFPYWRGRHGRLGELSEKLSLKLEKTQSLNKCLVNGWLVVPSLPCEYYFDTGSVGEALLELYEATGDSRYLKWVEIASSWAKAKPISPNYNYNSFIATMDAKLFIVTGDIGYLKQAVERTTCGVIAGEIETGPYAGHFIDPHNERIVYRKIITHGLIVVSTALAKDKSGAITQSEKERIYRATALATAALIEQMKVRGYSNSLIEIFRDIKTARQAGAPLPEPSAQTLALHEGHCLRLIVSGRGISQPELGLLLEELAQSIK